MIEVPGEAINMQGHMLVLTVILAVPAMGQTRLPNVDPPGSGRVEQDFELIRVVEPQTCLLYTSPSPRDRTRSRMPSSA